ncbi:MAG: type II toxin-antitoxin system RelE/ParE family toxin [Planctomycetota bacterium]
MTFPLLVNPEAEDDLANAYRWHEEQRSGLGREFLDRVEEAFERIRRTPEIHAVTYKTVRQTLVKRFPYVVCYTFEAERVHVIAVFHAHRDPSDWQSRAE